MGFIDASYTLQISRKLYMYCHVIVSTDSSFNEFKRVGCIEETFDVHSKYKKKRRFNCFLGRWLL